MGDFGAFVKLIYLFLPQIYDKIPSISRLILHIFYKIPKILVA